MGFMLVPAQGENVYVNFWNWHPTVELLRVHRILPAEKAKRLHFGLGAAVEAAEARRIHAFLTEYLEPLNPDQRVLLDLTVTDEPDTYEMYYDDPAKNYSAEVSWLQEFCDFCQRCDGFRVS